MTSTVERPMADERGPGWSTVVVKRELVVLARAPRTRSDHGQLRLGSRRRRGPSVPAQRRDRSTSSSCALERPAPQASSRWPPAPRVVELILLRLRDTVTRGRNGLDCSRFPSESMRSIARRSSEPSNRLALSSDPGALLALACCPPHRPWVDAARESPDLDPARWE